MLKKILSLVLVCVLVMGLVPAVSAAPGNVNPGISTTDVGDQTYYETEPNDDYTEANTLGNDYTVIGTMSGSDLDFYTFTLSKATDVAIASGADLSTLTFFLCDAQGNELAIADDNGYDSGIYMDSMGYALPTGTYYLVFLDEYENTGSYAYMFYLLQQEHTHVWDEGVVTAEPTYTATGVKTYTCGNCFETKTEEIPVISHAHIYVPSVVAPTCLEEGYTAHTCSICNDTYKDTFTKPLNHSWAEKVCQRCGVKFEEQFVDVRSDVYYFEPVMWAAENGITSGDSRFDTFNPDGDCSRAQVVTFLWRAAGEPEPNAVSNPFTDVKEIDYFYDAVLWAVENDITTGTTATTFSPHESCTRAQVVTFLHRTAGEPEPSQIPGFTDVPTDMYYYESVAWAVENGITNGIGGGLFSPYSACTRSQIVTFLHRYYTQSTELPDREPVDLSGLPTDEMWQEKTSVALTELPKHDAEPSEENILALLEACDPDGALLMKRGDSYGVDFTMWWDGEEVTLVSHMDTAVHEQCQAFQALVPIREEDYPVNGPSDAYYLGSGKYLAVAHTEVYPSVEMTDLIPQELRTSRFDTYVGADSEGVPSNEEGIYGLLNEFSAYSWGMNNTLSLLEYYKVQEPSVDLWFGYINSCENNIQAYAEFRYYMLTYLLYARDNYPEIYADILANEDLKLAFQSIDIRFAAQIDTYLEQLDEIETFLTGKGYTVEITDDTFYISTEPGSSSQRGLTRYVTTYETLMGATEASEYQEILAELYS